MVLNIIYPQRYWAAGPLVCRDTWHCWLCFRPRVSLSPESHVWINPQNSKTNANKFAPFGQVSSCILELCCGCSNKSPNDLDHFVISVSCTFYIPVSVSIHLFHQCCSQRSYLGIIGHGQLHSLANLDEFSLVWDQGQRWGLCSKPHWTGFWGTEVLIWELRYRSTQCNQWSNTFFTWGIAVCLVWATCYSGRWWLLPLWPQFPGWLQPACEFLCPWGLWENAEKHFSLHIAAIYRKALFNSLCPMEYKKGPELRAGAAGCCHHWNNNQWQQTIAFVCQQLLATGMVANSSHFLSHSHFGDMKQKISFWGKQGGHCSLGNKVIQNSQWYSFILLLNSISKLTVKL